MEKSGLRPKQYHPTPLTFLPGNLWYFGAKSGILAGQQGAGSCDFPYDPRFTLTPAGMNLKCYNDGDEEIVKCDENLGYRTCFIRYNESKLYP